ncbi:MAG: aldehyde dehydrogenase family protein [Verrucomicrobia bacterium]|nr:aldehyde dehydrogenase family protein [Verrucomicrobiota bacterium]
MTNMRMMIGGELVEAADGKRREIINPANEEPFATVAEAGCEDVRRAVAAASRAFYEGPWRTVGPSQRADVLERIANLIVAHREELATLDCNTVGRPIREIEGDIQEAARIFKYCARATVALMGETMEMSNDAFGFTVREPRGVVGLIIPWNYPMPNAAIKLAPALAAGNTCVLKVAELAPCSMLRLAELIQFALEIPPGVINVLSGAGETVGGELVRSPDVDFISFTGGTETGKEVMRLAAQTLKPVILELGGKSPNIILDDADFEAAVDGAVTAMFMGHGQVCVAGSRLLVQESIYTRFVRAVTEATRAIRVGHPLDRNTEMGPLISKEQWERVSGYVERGRREGARLVVGGGRPKGDQFRRGYYFEPTLLDKVDNRMTVAQEEIFGPVLCVMPFSDLDEAIAIANETRYGLAGGIWTRDISKALQAARALRTGIVWVNSCLSTFIELPSGGCRQSGFGRELGLQGLQEYTNIKQISIKTSSAPMGWFGRHAPP